MSKTIRPTGETDQAKLERGFFKVVDRAQKGDTSALAELKGLFHEGTQFWEEAGNLATQVERSLVKSAAGENIFFKEAVTLRLSSLKQEILGPAPAPLERLLVERIAVCWLQAHLADIRYAQATNVTFAHGDYYQRLQDRAHRRFLLAIRTLAQVRRLLIPAVQVNIGAQQVNVAGVRTGED